MTGGSIIMPMLRRAEEMTRSIDEEGDEHDEAHLEQAVFSSLMG
ncbi:hypothetical protein O0235_09325 [Tepidiforma flava]|uniref:Uncharacterized protein n=1 Tax=Tepidiforma flava TaxID=3004094 RepID=A0ABY7M5E2_9CHLR|nr:hypothetical protein [Tepidiforma flava]WBL34991.1 hypothetical protein O0235_09325 [Tepidiforma flava]